MPKRKKAKATKRRRRVGALALNANSNTVKIGSAVLGFLAGNFINDQIDKVKGNVDDKLVAAAQAGLGALLLFKKSGGKKGIILTVAGGVMAGAGVKRALSAFGIGGIGGYQSVPAISGYQDVKTVGASKGRRSIAGHNPGAGGMGMSNSGTMSPMRQAINGFNGTGSGVRDR